MGTLTDSDFLYLFNRIKEMLLIIAAHNEYEDFICTDCLNTAESLIDLAAVMLGHHAANELEDIYEKRRKGEEE